MYIIEKNNEANRILVNSDLAISYKDLIEKYFVPGVKDLSTDVCFNDCKKCGDLVLSRKQIVQSRGRNKTAKIFFIGMNPGYFENLIGVCFIGKSGKMLNYIIDNLGLRTEEFYIQNAVRCYLGRNDVNNDIELNNCMTYIRKEIFESNATKIVALGEQASNCVKLMIGKDLRVHDPIFDSERWWMRTYHPSYLCRMCDNKLNLSVINSIRNFLAKV